MAAPPTIDAAMCERLINSATTACKSVPLAPVSPVAQAVAAKPEPTWDALANSFASLSVALAWGSVIIAILTVLLGFGWGVLVKLWAEKEAQKEAKQCVEALMAKWLAEEAPQIIRRNVEYLQNASLGTDDDAEAADAMGEGAG